MKRVKKNRGISKTKKEWVYGDLLQINHKIYIHSNTYGDLNDIDFGRAFTEVIPETIGELVLSKNHQYNPISTDIFEGDIIRDWNGVREVKFEVTDDMQGYDLELDDSDFEVIGNIHQNPELLKNN